MISNIHLNARNTASTDIPNGQKLKRFSTPSFGIIDTFVPRCINVPFGASSRDTPMHFAEKRIASRYGLTTRAVRSLPPESPLHKMLLVIAEIEELRRNREIKLPSSGKIIHSEVWNGEELHPDVLQGVLGLHITEEGDTFGPTPAKLAERIVQAADLKPFHNRSYAAR